MKEEQFRYEEFEVLLAKKEYSELTAEERLWVEFFVSSESEYTDLRDTLMNIRSTFNDDKVEVKAGVGMKEALLDRFEQVHGKSSGAAGNMRPLFSGAIWKISAVAASAIVAFLLVFNTIGPKEDKSVAMDQSPVRVKAPVTLPHESTPAADPLLEDEDRKEISGTSESIMEYHAEDLQPAPIIYEAPAEREMTGYFFESSMDSVYFAGDKETGAGLKTTGVDTYQWTSSPGEGVSNIAYTYPSKDADGFALLEKPKILKKFRTKNDVMPVVSMERKKEIRKKLLCTDI